MILKPVSSMRMHCLLNSSISLQEKSKTNHNPELGNSSVHPCFICPSPASPWVLWSLPLLSPSQSRAGFPSQPGARSLHPRSSDQHQTSPGGHAADTAPPEPCVPHRPRAHGAAASCASCRQQTLPEAPSPDLCPPHLEGRPLASSPAEAAPGLTAEHESKRMSPRDTRAGASAGVLLLEDTSRGADC